MDIPKHNCVSQLIDQKVAPLLLTDQPMWLYTHFAQSSKTALL